MLNGLYIKAISLSKRTVLQEAASEMALREFYLLAKSIPLE